MQLTKYRSGNFVVFRVEELIHTTTSIAELRTQIEKTVRTECVNIAVRFSDDAMLRSSAVADLVLSAGLVHSRGGTFALIDPSETICRTLRALGVTNLITIVDNEHELDGQRVVSLESCLNTFQYAFEHTQTGAYVQQCNTLEPDFRHFTGQAWYIERGRSS